MKIKISYDPRIERSKLISLSHFLECLKLRAKGKIREPEKVDKNGRKRIYIEF